MANSPSITLKREYDIITFTQQNNRAKISNNILSLIVRFPNVKCSFIPLKMYKHYLHMDNKINFNIFKCVLLHSLKLYLKY